jgi:hypothetical protein
VRCFKYRSRDVQSQVIHSKAVAAQLLLLASASSAGFSTNPPWGIDIVSVARACFPKPLRLKRSLLSDFLGARDMYSDRGTCNIYISSRRSPLNERCIQLHSARPRELDPRGTRKVKSCCTAPRSNKIPIILELGPRQSLTLHVRGAALYSVNNFCASCRVRRGRTACLPILPEAWNPTPTKKWKWKWVLAGQLRRVGDLEGRPQHPPTPFFFFLADWKNEGTDSGHGGTGHTVLSSLNVPGEWWI